MVCNSRRPIGALAQGFEVEWRIGTIFRGKVKKNIQVKPLEDFY